MNLIKSLITSHGGAIVLLAILACIAGCTEAVRITPASPTMEPTLPIPSTSLVGVTPSPNATMNSCPIPKLIFNNSQEITNLKNTPGIRFTGETTSQDSRPGTVPAGGIIYHEKGFTRIFDSAGIQILFVNDSESVAPIPAGMVVPLSYVIDASTVGVMSPAQDINVTYVYQEGDDTCIAAIIRTPDAFSATIPPH